MLRVRTERSQLQIVKRPLTALLRLSFGYVTYSSVLNKRINSQTVELSLQ